MLRSLFVGFLLLMFFPLAAQTLGGNAVFNFLKQPNAAQLSALGGVNVSNITSDISLAFHNPSLLRSSHHAEVNNSINLMVGGIRNYSLTSGWFAERQKTTVALGVSYFDYGRLPQTDAAGNELGNFKPNDFVVQIMSSRRHKAYWHYGATLKFIQSSYGSYRSNGIAADIGLTFSDTTKGMHAAVVVKNIGTQLRTYNGSNQKEELPFDLQAGITKRFKNAPVQFSLTAHNLHRLNVFYNDTSFLASEGADDFKGKNFTMEKVLTHLVFASQFYVKDKLEFTLGYNFLRRNDLNVYNTANGLNGLSMGGGLLLRDLQVRYATGFYQQNMFNQLSINFSWK